VSTSDETIKTTDFERWLAAQFATTGAFTALVILVDIGTSEVTPLCSTYLNVAGDEVKWSDMVVMCAASGTRWNGAAFFPVTAPEGGLLDSPTARLGLQVLEERIDDDRLVLNEGFFFDSAGERLRIEAGTAP
jgi:hypothetical protein